MATPKKINDPGPTLAAMLERICLVDDLLGGTITMRNARERWLPKERGEKGRDYESRLSRSFLYEGLRDTIDDISSRPFSKPVALIEKEKLPDQLQVIEKDVDGNGLSLTSFAKEVFDFGVRHGLVHVLVDYPPLTGVPTLKEEREQNIHPRFKMIRARDLLDFVPDTGSGREALKEVRIREEADGVTVAERVMVLKDTGEWIRYSRKPEEAEFKEESRGLSTFKGIPLRTFYTNRVGYMSATPPLEGLAWMNVAHWQSASDQRNILKIVRIPILTQSGVSGEEASKPLTISAYNVIRSINPDMKLEFVEHTGKAVEVGQKDLADLEQKMQALGSIPYSTKVQKTATEAGIDEGRSLTSIHQWVRDFSDFLRGLFVIGGEWIGQEVPDDFKAQVFSEFSLGARATGDIKEIQATRARGDLSLETFLKEMQRRGFLDENIDIDEEIQRIEDEGLNEPDPGLMDILDGMDPTVKDAKDQKAQKPPKAKNAGE